MANNYIKKKTWPLPLASREIQTEIILKVYLIPFKMAIIKKTNNNQMAETVEWEGTLTQTSSVNVVTMEITMKVPQKLKLSHYIAVSHLDTRSKKFKSAYYTYLHIHVNVTQFIIVNDTEDK